MCWISKKLKFKKAKKDIRVYKVLKENLASQIFDFKYIPGVINVSSEPEFTINYENGINTFNDSEYYYLIHKAFHSYKSVKITKENNVFDGVIKPFIIPKGSIYAINKNGEIVSNQIMMEV